MRRTVEAGTESPSESASRMHRCSFSAMCAKPRAPGLRMCDLGEPPVREPDDPVPRFGEQRVAQGVTRRAVPSIPDGLCQKRPFGERRRFAGVGAIPNLEALGLPALLR